MFTLDNATPEQAAEFVHACDDWLEANRRQKERNGAHHFISEQNQPFADLPAPKPCPFCALRIIRIDVEHEDAEPDPFCEARCDHCGATEGGGHRTPESAAGSWNTRESAG